MSGRRDESLLLEELIDAAERLVELGRRVPEGHLGLDREIREMMLWNLMVMGEAAKRLSMSARQRFADVPWKRIAGTRDRVTHDYEGLDWTVIGGIIADDLPALLPRLTEIRDTLREEYDAV